MHDYGTGFSEHESKVLFAGFDLNKNGSVDYDEFLRFVRGPLNPFRQALVDKAFAIMDRDGNGYIDYNDLKGRYDASYHPEVKAGRKTEREALGEWLETFETHHNMFTGGHNDQIVTKEEWNEYYANVSSSIDRDDYFELMMNSAWKLGEHKRTYGSGWSSTGATHVSQTLADAYGQQQQPSRAGGKEMPSSWMSYQPFKNEVPSYQQKDFHRHSEDYGCRHSPTRVAPPHTAGVATQGIGTKTKPISDRDHIFGTFRNALSKRGVRGIFGMARSFRIADDDRSGSLCWEEFNKAMNDFRVALAHHERQ